MSSAHPEALLPFRCGATRVDPARLRVERADQAIRLEPKAMDLLLCLVRAGGEVVTKEELLRTVWPDAIVSEVGLARLVSDLRKALGDDVKHPVFIETVPKRGYRLTAPVEPDFVASGARRQGREGRRPSRRWLAANLAGFLVATGLWVSAAVPGEPEGDRRQAAYGFTLKGRDLYRGYRLPDNEQAITLFRRAIEKEPRFALAHAELASALALQTIRYQLGGDWLEQARLAAEKSLALEPELAEGHKALGMLRSFEGRHREAAAAFERALRFRPDYPEALYGLAGELQCLGRLDRSLALLAAWSRQGRFLPQDFVSIGIDYLVLGELATAREWLVAAARAEPHQVDAQVALAQVDLKDRDPESARRRLEQLLAVFPDCTVCLATLGDAERKAGQFERAEGHYRSAVEQSAGRDLYSRLRLAEGLVRRGERAAAEPHLAAVEHQVREALRAGQDAPYFHLFLATIAGLREDPEAALAALEQAVAVGWLGSGDELDELAFRSLATDPRFRGLVARLEAEVERQRERAPRLALPGGPSQRGAP